MASGVSVDPAVSASFNDLKLKKTSKYQIYRISSDLKQIEVEKIGDKNATFADFTAFFEDSDCRYGVFDFDFELPCGTSKSKILFISWAPDTAKVKSKMLYASSKDALKKSLKEGISYDLQACDKSDLEYSEILKEFIKKDRN